MLCVGFILPVLLLMAKQLRASSLGKGVSEDVAEVALQLKRLSHNVVNSSCKIILVLAVSAVNGMLVIRPKGYPDHQVIPPSVSKSKCDPLQQVMGSF